MKSKTKTPQQEKEALRKRCVTLAKKIARMRDGYKCQYCGQGEPNRITHGSHVYAEGHCKSMSADTDNIICLCWLCHMGGLHYVSTDRFSWHGTPAEAMDWFQEKYPDLAEELKKRSRELKVCDKTFWENKLHELKEEQKLYEK